MDALWYAVIASTLISLVLTYVELASESGERGRALFSLDAFAYLLLVTIGNVLLTLLAPAALPDTFITDVSISTGSPDEIDVPRWVWYTLTGVFGFTALLRNLDIKILSQSFLSFSEYLEKARDNATVSIVERAIEMENKASNRRAHELRSLPENDLNTLLLHTVGEDELANVEAIARTENRDAHFLKALLLAQTDPVGADSLLEQQHSAPAFHPAPDAVPRAPDAGEPSDVAGDGERAAATAPSMPNATESPPSSAPADSSLPVAARAPADSSPPDGDHPST
jgi:hypothetical protein